MEDRRDDHRRFAVVLEDDGGVRQLLDAILQTEGWGRVLGATWEDVRDAAECADLMLVDHRLPGPSGLEVIKEMRGKRPDMKLVMLTGDSSARERAEHLGVDGFLLKPFDVTVLIELLRTVAAHDEPTHDLRPPIDLRDATTPWYASN